MFRVSTKAVILHAIIGVTVLFSADDHDGARKTVKPSAPSASAAISTSEYLDNLAKYRFYSKCNPKKYELEHVPRYDLRVSRPDRASNRPVSQDRAVAIRKQKEISLRLELGKLPDVSQKQLIDLLDIMPFHAADNFNDLVQNANPEEIDEAHRLWVRFRLYQAPANASKAEKERVQEKNISLVRKADHILDTVYALDLNEITGIYDDFISSVSGGRTVKSYYEQRQLFKRADEAQKQKVDPVRYVYDQLGMRNLGGKADAWKCFQPNLYHWTPLKDRVGIKKLLWAKVIGVPHGDLFKASQQLAAAAPKADTCDSELCKTLIKTPLSADSGRPDVAKKDDGVSIASEPAVGTPKVGNHQSASAPSPDLSWASNKYLPEFIKAQMQELAERKRLLERKYHQDYDRSLSKRIDDPSVTPVVPDKEIAEVDAKIEALQKHLTATYAERVENGRKVCEVELENRRKNKVETEAKLAEYNDGWGSSGVTIRHFRTPFVYDPMHDPKETVLNGKWEEIKPEAYNDYLSKLPKYKIEGHIQALKNGLAGIQPPAALSKDPINSVYDKIKLAKKGCSDVSSAGKGFEVIDIDAFDRNKAQMTGPQLLEASLLIHRKLNSLSVDEYDLRNYRPFRAAVAKEINARIAKRQKMGTSVGDWPYDAKAFPRTKEGDIDWQLLIGKPENPDDEAETQRFNEAQNLPAHELDTALRAVFPSLNFPSAGYNDSSAWWNWAKSTPGMDYTSAAHPACVMRYLMANRLKYHSRQFNENPEYIQFKAQAEKELSEAEKQSLSVYKTSVSRIEELIQTAEAVASTAKNDKGPLGGNSSGKDVADYTDFTADELMARVGAGEVSRELCLALKYPPHLLAYYNLLNKAATDKDGSPENRALVAGQLAELESLDNEKLVSEWKWYDSHHFDGGAVTDARLPANWNDKNSMDSNSITQSVLPDFRDWLGRRDTKRHWIGKTGFDFGDNPTLVDPRFRTHAFNGRQRLSAIQAADKAIDAANPVVEANGTVKAAAIPIPDYLAKLMNADTEEAQAMLISTFPMNPEGFALGRLESIRQVWLGELQRMLRGEQPMQRGIDQYHFNPDDPKRNRMILGIGNAIRSIDKAIADKYGGIDAEKMTEVLPELAKSLHVAQTSDPRELNEKGLEALGGYLSHLQGEMAYNQKETNAHGVKHSSPMDYALKEIARPECVAQPDRCIKKGSNLESGHDFLEDKLGGGIPSETRMKILAMNPYVRQMYGAFLNASDKSIRYECKVRPPVNASIQAGDPNSPYAKLEESIKINEAEFKSRIALLPAADRNYFQAKYDRAIGRAEGYEKFIPGFVKYPEALPILFAELKERIVKQEGAQQVMRSLLFQSSSPQIVTNVYRNPEALPRFVGQMNLLLNADKLGIAGINKKQLLDKLCEVPVMSTDQLRTMRQQLVDRLRGLVQGKKDGRVTYKDENTAMLLGFLIGSLEDLGLPKDDQFATNWLGDGVRYEPDTILARESYAKSLEEELNRKAATDVTAAARLAAVKRIEDFLGQQNTLLPSLSRIALLAEKPVSEAHAKVLSVLPEQIAGIPSGALPILDRHVEQYKHAQGGAVNQARRDFSEILLAPHQSNISALAQVASPALAKEMGLAEVRTLLERPLIDYIKKNGTVPGDSREFNQLLEMRFLQKYANERNTLMKATAADGNLSDQAKQQLQDLRDSKLPEVAEDVQRELLLRSAEEHIASVMASNPKYGSLSFHSTDDLYGAIAENPALKTEPMKKMMAGLKALTQSDHTEGEILGQSVAREVINRRVKEDLGGFMAKGSMPACLREGLKEEIRKNLSDAFSGNLLDAVKRTLSGDYLNTDEADLLKKMLIPQDLSGDSRDVKGIRSEKSAEISGLMDSSQYFIINQNLLIVEIGTQIKDKAQEIDRIKKTLGQLASVESLPMERKKKNDELEAKLAKTTADFKALESELEQAKKQVVGRAKEANIALLDRLTKQIDDIGFQVGEHRDSWDMRYGGMARKYSQYCLKLGDVIVSNSAQEVDPSRSQELAVVEEFQKMQEILGRGKAISLTLPIANSPMFGAVGDSSTLALRFANNHPNKQILRDWIEEARKNGIPGERARAMVTDWLKQGIAQVRAKDEQTKKIVAKVEAMRVYDPKIRSQVDLDVQWNGHNWKVKDYSKLGLLTTPQKKELDTLLGEMQGHEPTAENVFRQLDLEMAQKHFNQDGSTHFLFDKDTAVLASRDRTSPSGYKYKLRPKKEAHDEMKELLAEIRKKMKELEFASEKMMAQTDALATYVVPRPFSAEGLTSFKKYKAEAEKLMTEELPAMISKLKEYGYMGFEDDPVYKEMNGKTAKDAAALLAGSVFDRSVQHLSHLHEAHARFLAASNEAAAWIAIEIATWGTASLATSASWAAQMGAEVMLRLKAAARIHNAGKVFTKGGNALQVLALEGWYARYGDDHWKQKMKEGKGDFPIPMVIDRDGNQIPDFYERPNHTFNPLSPHFSASHPWIVGDARENEKALYSSLAVFAGAGVLNKLGLLKAFVATQYAHPLNFGISGCLTELAKGKTFEECAMHGVRGFLVGLGASSLVPTRSWAGQILSKNAWNPALFNLGYLSALDVGFYALERAKNEEVQKQHPGAIGFLAGAGEAMYHGLAMNAYFSRGVGGQYINKANLDKTYEMLKAAERSGRSDSFEKAYNDRLNSIDEKEFRRMVSLLPAGTLPFFKQGQREHYEQALKQKEQDPAALAEFIKEQKAVLLQGELRSAVAQLSVNEAKTMLEKMLKQGQSDQPNSNAYKFANAVGVDPKALPEVLAHLQGVFGSNKETLGEVMEEVQKASHRKVAQGYLDAVAVPEKAQQAKKDLHKRIKNTGAQVLSELSLNRLVSTLDLTQPADKELALEVGRVMGLPRQWENERNPGNVRGLDADRFLDFLQNHGAKVPVENKRMLFSAAFVRPEILGEMVASGEIEPLAASRIFGRERTSQAISAYKEKSGKPGAPANMTEKAKEFVWAASDMRVFEKNRANYFNPATPKESLSKAAYYAKQRAHLKEILQKRPASLEFMTLDVAIGMTPEVREDIFVRVAQEVFDAVKAKTGKEVSVESVFENIGKSINLEMTHGEFDRKTLRETKDELIEMYSN